VAEAEVVNGALAQATLREVRMLGIEVLEREVQRRVDPALLLGLVAFWRLRDV